jgi:phage tail sheath protein FI
MPEYLAPGVYIEEVELGAKPIEGVSTSTAGLLGPTERGPVDPRLVVNFTKFQDLYGGFLSDSFLAHAVEGFFRNGGQRCFVGRVVGAGAAAAGGDLGPVRLEAVGPGAWGNRVFAKVADASLTTAASPDLFKLTLLYWRTVPPDVDGGALVDPTDPRNRLHPDRREPDVLEVFDNLSPVATSGDYYERRVNGVSRLVELVREADGRPAAQGGAEDADLNGTGSPGLTLNGPLTGGGDGAALALADYRGATTPGARTGLAALADVDEISMLGVPDEDDAALAGVTGELIDQCENLKDRFAVTAALDGTRTDPASLQRVRDTKYAAVYYPWIRIVDPVTGGRKLVPPTGHVLGVYARSDTERGVHKAPANEVVRGAVDLEFAIAKGEQDLLNPRGINVIRSLPGRGIRVWGARTMSSDGAWKYVNVRRLFIFLEESIDQGTQYAVFEPNDVPLWEQVRGSVTAFLTTQWRDGKLQGRTPAEAFFVRVGIPETMTQDDVDNGRLIVLVGVAPVRPAEFVIFRITQMPRGSDITE